MLLLYLCGFLFVGTMSSSNRIELPEDDETGLSQEDLDLLPTPVFSCLKRPAAKTIKRPAASMCVDHDSTRPAASTCVDHDKIKRPAASTCVDHDKIKRPAASANLNCKPGQFNMLELFSGTGSIGKAFTDLGWTCTSLDITSSPSHTPDIMIDIMDWNYVELPESSFDVIWASPPCTEYSKARTTAKKARNFELADALVRTTLDIVKHFKPQFYIIENPASGLLKSRGILDNTPHMLVDYCKYGTLYRKRTMLWGSFPNILNLMTCKYDCKACDKLNKNHPRVAQRGDG